MTASAIDRAVQCVHLGPETSTKAFGKHTSLLCTSAGCALHLMGQKPWGFSISPRYSF